MRDREIQGRNQYRYQRFRPGPANRATVTSSGAIETGKHIYTAEFAKTGDDPKTHSATGTLTLYEDMKKSASDEIITQPGMFSPT